jgi:hypothetical protein
MDFPDKTVLLYDRGLFISWAETLAKYFGRVLLYTPYKSQFVTSSQMRLGYGIPGVEHINPFGETKGKDFWDIVNDTQIDLFIFLDIGEADIQAELKRKGKRVWGSGNGDDLELYRPEAKQTFEQLGLPQRPWETVTGTDPLRKVLEKAKHPRWVKISGHRGDIESFKYDPKWPEDSEQDLRRLEDRLGRGVMSKMEFTVEDEIAPAVEVGYDGPSIDGEYPAECLVGIEQKDESYFGIVTAYSDLPDQMTVVNQALAPILRQYEYRNFISTEIRIPDDLEPYLIDMTCRAPSPPSEGYQEIVDNWGEIFWYGAEGILVPWQFKHKFMALAVIHNDAATTNAEAVRFDDSIGSYIKLKNYCVIDGVRWVLPQTVPLKEIGCVVGSADDPVEAVRLVHERVGKTNQKAVISSLGKAIQNFKDGIESGVEFKNLELPDVEELARVTA